MQPRDTLISTISGPINKLERFSFANCDALVHLRDKCDGDNCPIHNPSPHHMRDWPMILRTSGLVERRCPSRIGHPDPDSAEWLNKMTSEGQGWELHGCDGCCDPNHEAIPVDLYGPCKCGAEVIENPNNANPNTVGPTWIHKP